ncbi:MAG: c-type cytochrome [Actinomycetota bacterium]|nr:c-type cytochrome [Actinomycetota bacterium]
MSSARLFCGVAGAAILAAAAVAVLSGCGTDGVVKDANAALGQQLFMGKGRCGQCHTLAAAGARGTTGPNLDEALGPLRTKELGGFDESTIRQVVHDQILYPAPPMPPELLKGEEAEAVAAYVASVAGRPPEAGGGGIAAPAPPAGGGGQGGGGTGGEAGGTTGGAAGGGGTGGATDEGEAVADGKSIFNTNCAACHVFTPAGAKGTVGPNLDQPKRPYDLVRSQVVNGGNGMPAFKGQLTDAQIDAVSKFVAGNK